MSGFYSLSLTILKLFCFLVVKCNILPLNLKNITEAHKFYQITSFVSSRLQKIDHFQLSPFEHLSNEIHSFDFNNTHQMRSSNKSSKYAPKNKYSLQESLIILFTSDLSEIKSFIDFLIPQLSVRQRPKCLIVLLTESDLNKNAYVSHILRYTWKKRFLDFTILVKKLSNNRLIYYLNPFNEIFFQKRLEENIEIFPEKLQNAYGYPFRTMNFNHLFRDFVIDLRPHKQAEVIYLPEVPVYITAGIFNMKCIKKNISFPEFYDNNFLEKHELDTTTLIFKLLVEDFPHYLIPSNVLPSTNIVATVPILFISREVISFVNFVIVVIASGIIFTTLFLLKYFNCPIGYLSILDAVRLLLDQPIKREPQKTAYRIIFLTITIVSVSFMNTFILNMVSILIEQEEITFETYEDLLNSQLQFYIVDIFNLNTTSAIKPTDRNEHLLSLYKKTKLIPNYEDCFKNVINYKNVSCITNEFIAKYYSKNYTNKDGSAIMKIAEPPISNEPVFHWFADASPYPMKFLKKMRRIQETSLVYYLALTDKKTKLFYEKEETTQINNQEIKLYHLMLTLSFCFFTSAVIFIFEVINFKFGKKISKVFTNV